MDYRLTRPAARRPMDKKMINVDLTVTSAAQDSTVLATATFPGTIVGLRWDLDAQYLTNVGNIAWAIVVVREGSSASTLSLADGNSLYEPEQNVMAGGIANIPGSNAGVLKIQGSTKAMRKLQGGDQLLFLVLGSANPCGEVTGTIQYFVKT